MSNLPKPIPVNQISLEKLADLLATSYGILGVLAPGPRDQATAFDDWLESYRRTHPHGLAGMLADYANCPHVLRDASLGTRVVCWRLDGEDDLFACALAPGDFAQYVIPRDADDVPNILPEWPAVTRFLILAAEIASQLTLSPTEVDAESLQKCRQLASTLKQSSSPSAVQMGSGSYEVSLVRPDGDSDAELPCLKFFKPLLQSQPDCLFRIGPAKLPATINLVIPPGNSSEALDDALQALIFLTGFRKDGSNPEVSREATRAQILAAGPAIVTAFVEMPQDEDRLAEVLEISTNLGAALMWPPEREHATADTSSPAAPTTSSTATVETPIQPVIDTSRTPPVTTAPTQAPRGNAMFVAVALLVAAAAIAVLYFVLMR